MSTVIFQTENTIFTFSKKEVKEHLIFKQTEFAPHEVNQLLKLISTNSDDAIIAINDHHYFGYVALDLIGSCIGTVTCQICGKSYDAGQLKEFAIGLGKSPFAFNHEQKGGFSLFRKRKNPSLFGGKGFKCPAGHRLISMKIWKT